MVRLPSDIFVLVFYCRLAQSHACMKMIFLLSLMIVTSRVFSVPVSEIFDGSSVAADPTIPVLHVEPSIISRVFRDRSAFHEPGSAINKGFYYTLPARVLLYQPPSGRLYPTARGVINNEGQDSDSRYSSHVGGYVQNIQSPTDIRFNSLENFQEGFNGLIHTSNENPLRVSPEFIETKPPRDILASYRSIRDDEQIQGTNLAGMKMQQNLRMDSVPIPRGQQEIAMNSPLQVDPRNVREYGRNQLSVPQRNIPSVNTIASSPKLESSYQTEPNRPPESQFLSYGPSSNPHEQYYSQSINQQHLAQASSLKTPPPHLVGLRLPTKNIEPMTNHGYRDQNSGFTNIWSHPSSSSEYGTQTLGVSRAGTCHGIRSPYHFPAGLTPWAVAIVSQESLFPDHYDRDAKTPWLLMIPNNYRSNIEDYSSALRSQLSRSIRVHQNSAELESTLSQPAEEYSFQEPPSLTGARSIDTISKGESQPQKPITQGDQSQTISTSAQHDVPSTVTTHILSQHFNEPSHGTNVENFMREEAFLSEKAPLERNIQTVGASQQPIRKLGVHNIDTQPVLIEGKTPSSGIQEDLTLTERRLMDGDGSSSREMSQDEHQKVGDTTVIHAIAESTPSSKPMNDKGSESNIGHNMSALGGRDVPIQEVIEQADALEPISSVTTPNKQERVNNEIIMEVVERSPSVSSYLGRVSGDIPDEDKLEIDHEEPSLEILDTKPGSTMHQEALTVLPEHVGTSTIPQQQQEQIELDSVLQKSNTSSFTADSVNQDIQHVMADGIRRTLGTKPIPLEDSIPTGTKTNTQLGSIDSMPAETPPEQRIHNVVLVDPNYPPTTVRQVAPGITQIGESHDEVRVPLEEGLSVPKHYVKNVSSHIRMVPEEDSSPPLTLSTAHLETNSNSSAASLIKETTVNGSNLIVSSHITSSQPTTEGQYVTEAIEDVQGETNAAIREESSSKVIHHKTTDGISDQQVNNKREISETNVSLVDRVPKTETIHSISTVGEINPGDLLESDQTELERHTASPTKHTSASEEIVPVGMYTPEEHPSEGFTTSEIINSGRNVRDHPDETKLENGDGSPYVGVHHTKPAGSTTQEGKSAGLENEDPSSTTINKTLAGDHVPTINTIITPLVVETGSLHNDVSSGKTIIRILEGEALSHVNQAPTSETIFKTGQVQTARHAKQVPTTKTIITTQGEESTSLVDEVPTTEEMHDGVNLKSQRTSTVTRYIPSGTHRRSEESDPHMVISQIGDPSKTMVVKYVTNVGREITPINEEYEVVETKRTSSDQADILGSSETIEAGAPSTSKTIHYIKTGTGNIERVNDEDLDTSTYNLSRTGDPQMMEHHNDDGRITTTIVKGPRTKIIRYINPGGVDLEEIDENFKHEGTTGVPPIKFRTDSHQVEFKDDIPFREKSSTEAAISSPMKMIRYVTRPGKTEPLGDYSEDRRSEHVIEEGNRFQKSEPPQNKNVDHGSTSLHTDGSPSTIKTIRFVSNRGPTTKEETVGTPSTFSRFIKIPSMDTTKMEHYDNQGDGQQQRTVRYITIPGSRGASSHGTMRTTTKFISGAPPTKFVYPSGQNVRPQGSPARHTSAIITPSSFVPG